MSKPETTQPDERKDGLYCVYGECQGVPRFPRECNPGCYFQMSAISEIEMLRRHIESLKHEA